jgi:hypothetical protein
MTGGTNRATTVRASVHGGSAVAFETALQDNRLKNSLTFFPSANEASKFLGMESVGLLEWSTN